MRKLNFKKLGRLAVMAYLSLYSVACSKRLAEGDPDVNSKVAGKSVAAIAGNMVLMPAYNSTAILRNPMNGWVLYAGGNSDQTYWDKTYTVPGVANPVKAIDYASACYIRTSWAKLNPADGVYAWRDPNSTLGNLIKGAATRGLPIAFRIVVDGRDQGLNTPQFVFDAGAQYYLENASFPLRRTPYPQDPVFKQYYTKFIAALASDFNDPKKTAFIDAYGLGKWGEAHNTIYEDPATSNGSNTETLKAQVLDWITTLYTQQFTKVPLVINYHRLVGHPASWGAPNANTTALLESAINKGYSLRQDAFGMTDYYQSWERAFAATWKHKRPIIMEGGWITTGTHRYWIDPSGNYREGHPEDVRLGEFNASQVAAVNMMDFRVGEAASWFQTSFPLVQRFITEGGYRLYPDEVSLPETVTAGATASLSHRWVNMGWGYCPNNIPQWNYKYKVAFAILDGSNVVKKLFIDNNSDPSKWIKGAPTTYNLTTTSVDLAPGTYTWAIAIIDKTDANKPGISLAVTGDVSNGWLKLGSLQVQTAVTAPPVGQSIKLRGSNNLFASGENGQSSMMCNRTSASTWETFTIVDAGGGKVALKSMDKYVSSENGATTGITCKRTTISDWEKFDWIVNANGRISLRGNNGNYISSEDGQSVMKCNRATISGWETFTLN
ncbi:DUF4832 domain-containing protein [Mucilaginibacter terrae]|uniref:DUF4832 domain-containing protein n=1 Tax=Mucilaginibacter terrae TaxID=1955052 RepID=A0ABU3GQL8_9SPHI|nr:DUF4832 domain-containing protein [Mucilaginibacter terrae]MDT3402057.1 hypothetical protein [Mucilaginibacter terrae]